MRIKVAATRVVEWLAIKLNLVPVPLIHTQLMPLLSQAVLEAHQLGLFNHFETQPHNALSISDALNTDPQAMQHLLALLATGGYLRPTQNGYRLTTMARKFCLSSSPYSLHSQQLFNHACQPRWQAHLGQYLQTGKGLDSHHTFTSSEWQLYQKGMNTLPPQLIAQMVAPLPISKKAAHMLDIGGAHGQYALAFANQHKGLHVTVLDLPEALASSADTRVAHASINYLPADALTYDYPPGAYDVLFISNLLHHFDPVTVATLCKKAAQSLKPGGLFIIQDFLKPDAANADFASTALDLYFSLTSSAGCYALPQLKQFLEAAGCRHIKHRKVWQMPGLVQVCGSQPG